MGQFFKFLLASCLGTFIALVAAVLFFTGMLTGLANSVSQPSGIGPNSVLRLKLDQPIPELTDNVEEISLDPNQHKTLGVHAIVAAIDQAAGDDDIKGIFVETEQMQAGFATTDLIRDALLRFRQSGKPVLAHAPYYSQGAYYLASAADSVYVSPLGLVDFRGPATQIPFVKDMLDRVGVEMQVFYAGEFKSATEPFRRQDMSPENRLQTRAYLDALYGTMLQQIGAARGRSETDLRQTADTYAGRSPEGALAAGLVDGIAYREAVLARWRTLLGLDTNASPALVGLHTYHAARVKATPSHPNKVAVLIAEGSIVDGKGDAGSIGDEKYVKLIEEIRRDASVKAVVLRVNSPGGSASASAHIWQALRELKAAGKPLVVSMGDYAASGGYYLAAPADSIFAQAATLTGSIGVFLTFPSMQTLFNDRLGITFDTVLTGRYSAGFSPLNKLGEAERRMLQERTDALYQTFLGVVSDGRGISVAAVDSVARGRVWVGAKAREIGLVDRIAGLPDAVESSAALAGLTTGDYQTIYYPAPKAGWERLLEDWFNQEDVFSQMLLRHELGDNYAYYHWLRELGGSKGEQMRLPFRVEWQ